MPVASCPRCHHVNPEYASFCYFDGIALHATQNAVVLRLPGEFAFPSGRRCKTFDELAQACQEEWTAARDLLARGVFAQFFQTGQRADLVRAANDAKAQPNPDIALMTFLNALPGMRTHTPKLDLHPRRILLGNVPVGDSRTQAVTISNQGQGMLQGTVTVTDGQDWLSLSDTGPVHEIAVNAVRDQVVKLSIRTRGIAAGQTYGAKLTVVTNGGVGELPLRIDVLPQPYSKPPFQGVRSQRELAEKVRQHPKVAVPILESGDIQRWFALNGWNYPVVGTPIKGVGGVQQFFEGMGLSKPPPVQLSQSEFRFTCKYRDTLRAQATLQTRAKKWVYAQVTSDAPWLKVLNPQISGPQHATVPLEIDTALWKGGASSEGKVTFLANGGQKLLLRVFVEVQGLPDGSTRPVVKPSDPAPPRTADARSADAANPFHALSHSPVAPTVPRGRTATEDNQSSARPKSLKGGKFLPAMLTMVLLCVSFRLLLIPFIDVAARSRATASTEATMSNHRWKVDEGTGAWLRLPWPAILTGVDATFSSKLFDADSDQKLSTLEFRHFFISSFLREFVFWTWWLGALLGAWAIYRHGGTTLDIVRGVVAGGIAGIVGAATLAAFFLVIELLPHSLWYIVMGEHGGPSYLILWTLLAVLCWLLLGVLLGVTVPAIGPLRRWLVDPFQSLFAQAFRRFGMQSVADSWTP